MFMLINVEPSVISLIGEGVHAKKKIMVLIALAYAIVILSNACGPTNSPKQTATIPMRDGRLLATDLYFPKKTSEPLPVILIRTPYNKDFLADYGRYYSQWDYVVAIQNVRGRHASQGEWKPFLNEGNDGYDTIEWLAMRDWSSGKIGMVGGSYSGFTQFAAAVRKPPHLVTIIPNVTPAVPFGNLPYDGGAMLLGWSIRWADLVENARTGREIQQKLQTSIKRDWTKPLNDLPVTNLDNKIVGREVDYWREWIGHNSLDGYWRSINYLDSLSFIEMPVFLQSGWFDGGIKGVRYHYEGLRENESRPVKLIIGPWVHSDRASRFLEGRDMGKNADMDLFDLYRRWFDHWLKGEDTGIMDEPATQVFLMGPNHWLSGSKYPPQDVSYTRYYLTNTTGRNDKSKGGTLTTSSIDSGIPFSEYTYDPGDPTPSFYAHLKRGALAKYHQISSSRNDILVYETPILNKPLTLSGPISLSLFASSSAKDTDWVATIYGVNQDNVAYPLGLTFGVLRARFRNSMSSPELLEPNRIYEYEIDLAHTAVQIKPGHRLRLEIASAAFPQYSRNLNTGGQNEQESQFIKAEQRIYHSPKYPSSILLPILN